MMNGAPDHIWKMIYATIGCPLCGGTGRITFMEGDSRPCPSCNATERHQRAEADQEGEG